MLSSLLEFGPCGWTESSGSFDRLLGVLILELHRAEVTYSRVQPLRVVNLIDEPRRSAVTSERLQVDAWHCHTGCFGD